MPAHVPPRKEEPEPGLSQAEMLRVRDEVKEKLVRAYHSHRLTARLYRNQGNISMVKVEEAHMAELRRMLRDLEAEPEPMKGTSVRLLEGAGGDTAIDDGA